MHGRLILAALLLARVASAATTLHGTTTLSLVKPMQTQGSQGGCQKTSTSALWDYTYFLLNNAAPSSATSEAWIPTATGPPCFFQRGTANNSTFIFFVSKPLSAAFTISGTVSGKCAGAESAAQANAGCSFLVYRWDGKLNGLAQNIWNSGTTAEYGTSCAAGTIASASPVSTAFAIGDRIVVVPVVQAVGAWGGNNSRTVSLCWNGAAAGANEVSITFTENLTFSADAAPGKQPLVTSD